MLTDHTCRDFGLRKPGAGAFAHAPSGISTSSRVLRIEWGRFLQSYPWSHFLTLTSREERSPEHLLVQFRRYARSLERIVQRRVGWFVAAEETCRGCAHLHALTSGTEQLTTRRLGLQWRPGHTRIRCYDRTR